MGSVLNRELFMEALVGTLLLVFAFSFPSFSPWQLLPALAVHTFVWMRAWQLRLLNRRSNEAEVLPTLGWANRLTLLRGWLIAACAGFLWPPADSAALLAPALCYSLAAMMDALDGRIARSSNTVTLFGTQFDTSMDALGLLIAPLVAVTAGKLHVSYLAVGAAYYLYIAGLHWRSSHGLAVHPLLPSRWRRPLAGLQMTVVAIALWPPVPPLWSQTAGFIAMLPFLAGFWRDWLVVSARR